MFSAGPRLISGFTPLNLPSLVGFWRADQGVTLGAGSAVATWADRSGGGNTLSVIGPNAPALATFNASFPGIAFSGVSGSVHTCLGNVAFSFASAAISVFVLADLTPAQLDDAGLVSFVKSGAADDFSPGNFIIALKHVGVANTFTAYSNGGIGDSGSSLVVPYSPTFTMLGFTVDGSGNGNAWVNGVVVGSPTSGTASFGANPNFISIGDRPIAGGNISGLNATVAFWGITAAAMSAGDWTNLKNWANANWGTAF